MAKLKREALIHFLDTGMNPHYYSSGTTAVTPAWEVIGEDIEDMSVELNHDIESIKNILGQTKVRDNGYEPSMDADPFYADSGSTLFTKLRDIVLDRKTGDDCKTLLLEVLVQPSDSTTHTAYVREVFVSPQSYGGDTVGVNIPFTVTDDGKAIEGTITAASLLAGAPVFSPAGS